MLSPRSNHLRGFLLLIGLVIGQHASAQLSISEPLEPGPLEPEPLGFGPLDDSSSEFAKPRIGKNQVNPIALTSATFPTETNPQPTEIQIHLKTHQVIVTAKQRRQIYEKLSDLAVKTETTLTPEPATSDLAAFTGEIESKLEGRSVRRCSRVVFPSVLLKQLIAEIEQDEHSKLERSPAVILIEGKQAETNNTSERPFAIDSNDSAAKNIEVLSEGTRLRLFAHRQPTSVGPSSSPAIRVVVELSSSRLDATSTDSVFIDKETFESRASPIQLTKSVTVASIVGSDESFLIDPLVNHPIQVQSTKPVPMIGKLPWVGQAFTRLDEQTIDQYLMVFLTPRIAAPQ